MLRSITIVLLASVCAMPTCGCGWGKKDDQQTSSKKGGERPTPDPFETSEDPPLKANTRFAAGQLAESQRNFPAAIVQYQEALKLDPNHQGSLFRLGTVYTELRRFDDAISSWKRYLKVTNNSAAGYNNLALTYQAAGRFDEAEQAFRMAIEREPENASFRTNYGVMLASRGRIDEAVTQLSVVRTPAEVHYNLGSVFEQMGKKDEAKAYYRKALELDPGLHDARGRLEAMK